MRSLVSREQHFTLELEVNYEAHVVTWRAHYSVFFYISWIVVLIGWHAEPADPLRIYGLYVELLLLDHLRLVFGHADFVGSPWRILLCLRHRKRKVLLAAHIVKMHAFSRDYVLETVRFNALRKLLWIVKIEITDNDAVLLIGHQVA